MPEKFPENKAVDDALRSLQSFSLVVSKPVSRGEAAQNEKITFDTKVEETFSATLRSNPHPLSDEWTLWFFDEVSLVSIANFETIEGFWGLHKSLKPFDLSTNRADLSLFKKGIKPIWQDPRNINGGQWSFKCKKSEKYKNLWLKFAMAAVGGHFGSDKGFCGVYMSIKQNEIHFSFWHNNRNDKIAKYEIRDVAADLVEIGLELTDSIFFYQNHSRSNTYENKGKYFNLRKAFGE